MGARGRLRSAVQEDREEGDKQQYSGEEKEQFPRWVKLLLALCPPCPNLAHTVSATLMFVQGMKEGRDWMEEI